jgi:glycosyltransferase involved in cell wall biosynthesis
LSPPISVLLPVYDAASFLEEALDSIAGQSFEDYEVVAVDDGSTDASRVILEERASRDTRFRVIRREHAGIVAALEVARAASAGRYLARMDADDRADPDRFALQLALMDGCPEMVACGAHARYFPRDGITDGALRYERWLATIRGREDVDRELFVECPIAHPTFFLRANAVEAAGGYRAMGWPEDYDLLHRLRALGPIGIVPEVLLHWRDRPDRLSRTGADYSEHAFRRCKVHFLRERYPGRGVLIWGAGPVGKAFARELLSAGSEVVGFVDLDPRKLGQVIHGATVVGPEAVGAFRGALCLAAVGQPGARVEIRRALRSLGRREVEDFVAVA